MTYVDGFVVPVPATNREAYREMAAKAAQVFLACGALHVVECWGDDVPVGKTTDFRMAVKTEESENVAFSWIVWPSKEARNAGNARAMADPRMRPDPDTMPFDGKRMIYGGFTTIVDTAREG